MVTWARWKAKRGISRCRIGALNLSVLGGFDHASVEGCAVTVKVSGSDPFPGTASDDLRKLNCDMTVENSM